MKHAQALEEIRETAALYALGALSQNEARAFENHLAEGCETCENELKDFEAIVAGIGLGVAEESPSPGARERLMALVSESSRPEAREPARPSQFLSIHANDGEWVEVTKGVLMKRLSVDQSSGSLTSLVRMLPGTHLPAHKHKGVEQFFVLEGDCHVHGEILGPGDYHRAEAGSIHEATYTEGGTLFLLVGPMSY